LKSNAIPRDLNLLLQKLSIETTRKELYLQALTHSSYAHEKTAVQDNERLEFLGDAVLELIISEYLYERFPGLSEGQLTRMRSNLVCAPALNKIALNMELDQFILLSRGERASAGFYRQSILSSALEALIGALYLDQGFIRTREKTLIFFAPLLRSIGKDLLKPDYKTLLQEYYQASNNLTPSYSIVRETGPDHLKEFHAVVKVQETKLGEGFGFSKKEAQQAAAREALIRLGFFNIK